jgi:hypothetical protein
MNINEKIDDLIHKYFILEITSLELRQQIKQICSEYYLAEIEKLPDVEVAVSNKHGRIKFKSTKDIQKLLGDKCNNQTNGANG